MKLKLSEEDEKSVRVLVQEIPLSVANSIRRFIINEVPTMSVEEILIVENTSSLTNEILSHRISLVPFFSDLERYRAREECDCGSKLGCEKCVVRYVLKKQGAEGFVTAYTRDMTPEDSATTVHPASGDIPIVKLGPGQSLELELYVRVGRGKQHSKWQAGIATVYPPKKDSGEQAYELYIESYGFHPPKRLLREAIKVLKQKSDGFLETFDKSLEEGGSETTKKDN